MMRRVQVFFLVGMLVVVPVMCRPPEWTALGSTGPQNGKDQLRGTAGLEGFMGKVTVIKARDGEHPKDKKAECECHRKSADSTEKGKQASQVQGDKWDDPHDVE